MERYDIEKLRSLPIEGVAERLGMAVKRHACLCPFHDDHTPSLRFSVARNTYKCFVCNAHGGVIDLAMKKLDAPFLDACQWLANENNILLTGTGTGMGTGTGTGMKTFDASKYARFFEHPVLNDAAVSFLYDKRCLDSRVVSWCRLNSYKDWLQIPYFDVHGKLIGVQSRYLGTDKNQPRFRFPYGSSCPIYNLPVLMMLKEGEPLYITEGTSDCWAMLSWGKKAIAIPSATLLTKNNLKFLEPLKALKTKLHIYPDADIPGEKLYLQLVHISVELGLTLIRHNLPVGCKDFADYYVMMKK